MRMMRKDKSHANMRMKGGAPSKMSNKKNTRRMMDPPMPADMRSDMPSGKGMGMQPASSGPSDEPQAVA